MSRSNRTSPGRRTRRTSALTAASALGAATAVGIAGVPGPAAASADSDDLAPHTQPIPGGQPEALAGASFGSGHLVGSAAPRPYSPRQADQTLYTVRSGDTVIGIAKRYDTSVAAIVRANSLNSRALIRVGQVLTIPGKSASSSSGSSAGSGSSSSSGSSSARTTHTVRSGETVWSLANRYNTSVSAIVKANSLGSNAMIRIGQRLTIPGTSSSGSSSNSGGSSTSGGSSSSSGSSSASSSVYTVRSGDTLSSIASRHQVSVARISSANNLTGSLIHIGQRLTIPAPASNSDDLVPNTFLHYTYSDDVVAAANENKRTLNGMSVPSRTEMQQIIRQTAVRMGVDPSLALAIAHQESGFDARAVSPANAVGAMQVIPSSGLWASDLVGRPLNLLDPRDNAVAGVAILRALQRSSSDRPTAIASYYQGAGSVARNGMYSDTRRYVANVQTLMTRYG